MLTLINNLSLSREISLHNTESVVGQTTCLLYYSNDALFVIVAALTVVAVVVVVVRPGVM